MVCPECKKEKGKLKKDIRPNMCAECRDKLVKPDWEHGCDNCGATPTVPCVGLCGPCTWGEAETAGGNW